MFDSIVNVLLGLYDFIYDFGMSCINILSFIVSGLGFIWYAGKTLIIGVFKLISNIFYSDVFFNVGKAFVYISNYIGMPATVILSSVMFIAIIRIIVSFVFKLLRRNIDYTTLNKQTYKTNKNPENKKFNVPY